MRTALCAHNYPNKMYADGEYFRLCKVCMLSRAHFCFPRWGQGILFSVAVAGFSFPMIKEVSWEAKRDEREPLSFCPFETRAFNWVLGRYFPDNPRLLQPHEALFSFLGLFSIELVNCSLIFYTSLSLQLSGDPDPSSCKTFYFYIDVLVWR